MSEGIEPEPDRSQFRFQ